MLKLHISLLVFMLTVFTAYAADVADSSSYNYVGVKKCKMCHSAERGGGQYVIWQHSRHAQAFADLASDTAKAIAKSRGLGDPQKSPECLRCHVTGYGLPASRFESTYSAEDGVGCESCHGAGSGYWKATIMKSIYEGTARASDYGLVVPSSGEVCTRCHNSQSPFFRGFDFHADSAKIAHPIPKK
ncbi:MAG: multiheme c-type cytochrome [Candidatus Kryptoniota bacterium]